MSLDHDAGFVKPQTTTRDAFLGGRITVEQPAKGFRAGQDSVLLGAAVAAQSRSLCDLGTGAGTAALTALAHNAELTAVMAEADPALAGLAGRNVAANGFGARATVARADVAGAGKDREAAGLTPDTFTSVIANPPYFEAGAGTRAPEAGRAAARHMDGDALEKWVRAAAGCAAPQGEVIFIYRADGLAELLAAFAARFGAITVLPLAPRADAEATRVLVRGIKGSRAPLTLKAPLVLHRETGNDFQPGVEAIFRGSDTLHW